MLKLVTGQEVKITFGSPGGKSSFIDAITPSKIHSFCIELGHIRVMLVPEYLGIF
jgi:hypothetical protein